MGVPRRGDFTHVTSTSGRTQLANNLARMPGLNLDYTLWDKRSFTHFTARWPYVFHIPNVFFFLELRIKLGPWFHVHLLLCFRGVPPYLALLLHCLLLYIKKTQIYILNSLRTCIRYLLTACSALSVELGAARASAALLRLTPCPPGCAAWCRFYRESHLSQKQR